VVIGQDRTVVKAINKEVQYLGIWIAAKQSRKQWMDRLKLIVNDFLKVCNKKVLGVGPLAYGDWSSKSWGLSDNVFLRKSRLKLCNQF